MSNTCQVLTLIRYIYISDFYLYCSEDMVLQKKCFKKIKKLYIV